MVPVFRLTALLATLLAGCGDSASRVTTHPVRGKVILPDGKPLSQGVVTFVPTKEPGREATGVIKSDGTFSLTTQSPDDGAAEGAYRVSITSELTEPGPRGKKRFVLPTKYDDERTSGLEATVRAGTNDLPPFKLDNLPPRKLVASDDARD